ncbi:MAG: 23S rRNA (guanosine(2251)-2'-O)-methyltransferase RlmB [Firmicutes bacterium]|nr:23S rRNA (guanosine(2251)-2'-O)-methyltransferase RlmB [Bacillota bacterium]
MSGPAGERRGGTRRCRRAGEERGRAGEGRGGADASSCEIIPGRQAVLGALQAGRPLHRIMVAEGAAVSRIVSLARERGVPVQVTTRQVLEARAGGLRHQGVLAVAAALSYRSLDHLLAGIPAGAPALLVALSGVEDAGNLGAICRSAECLGAHGLIIPARRSAGLTPGAARAAAGALEWLPVARVVNLARSLGEVKERGLWVVGAEADGESLPWEVDLSVPLVLVLGGEERGLGHAVRQACDLVVRIPTSGRVPSLNVAAAAAILLYEVGRQRRMLASSGGRPAPRVGAGG